MRQEVVGFVGLGRMGAPMAERLVAAGLQVVICDVNADSLAPFIAAGASVATTAREVADRAKVVFSCLPTIELSLEAALGPDGVAAGRAVAVYIDTGTIGLRAAQEIAAKLPAHIGFLDAPVSGGPNGARAGTLTTMVSGPKPSFDLAVPYLSAIAKRVFHVGETAGQAQIAKLINNHLSTAGRLAAFEGLVMAMKAGIDPRRLLEIINTSTGRNHTTAEKIPAALRSGSFAYGARLANSIKDEKLLSEEAAALGVPLWVAPALISALTVAAKQGYLEQDSMFMVQFMGEQAGIDARALLEASGEWD